MKYKTLLFDLDGTLTDPAQGITNSVRYALQQHGYPIPDADILLSFIGPPLLDSFSALWGTDPRQTRALVDSFRVYFKDRGILENRLYDGIPALLSALRAAGYKLYLATSKPLVFARRVLSDFNIDTYFDGLYGSELDGTRDKKSDVIRYLLQNEKELAAQPLLMIGDRKYDVLGAAELGIPAVGVSYGYGSEGELSDAGAIAVLPTVAALYDYLLKEE